MGVGVDEYGCVGVDECRYGCVGVDECRYGCVWVWMSVGMGVCGCG